MDSLIDRITLLLIDADRAIHTARGMGIKSLPNDVTIREAGAINDKLVRIQRKLAQSIEDVDQVRKMLA